MHFSNDLSGIPIGEVALGDGWPLRFSEVRNVSEPIRRRQDGVGHELGYGRHMVDMGRIGVVRGRLGDDGRWIRPRCSAAGSGKLPQS